MREPGNWLRSQLYRRNSIMKFISTHVRLLEDQYEWLRRYCFENQVSQAEVIRVALEMFREKKEAKRT
jgi:hypothetical protein